MTVPEPRYVYYGKLKALAREVRKDHGLTSPKVTLTDMRRIYKAHCIRIDMCHRKLKNLRGAYMNDDLGVSVLLNASLPTEQRIFTLAHELKHHLADNGQIPSVAEDRVRDEIGAEIFAVELIFPEDAFVVALQAVCGAKGACTAEHIIRLKRDTGTTLSFTSLGKRAEILKYADLGAFAKVRWKILEEEIYGEPHYKQIARARRAAFPVK